jgi:hypothetical protein
MEGIPELVSDLESLFLYLVLLNGGIGKSAMLILKEFLGEECGVKLKSVSEDLLLSAERDDVRMTLPFLY